MVEATLGSCSKVSVLRWKHTASEFSPVGEHALQTNCITYFTRTLGHFPIVNFSNHRWHNFLLNELFFWKYSNTISKFHSLCMKEICDRSDAILNMYHSEELSNLALILLATLKLFKILLRYKNLVGRYTLVYSFNRGTIWKTNCVSLPILFLIISRCILNFCQCFGTVFNIKYFAVHIFFKFYKIWNEHEKKSFNEFSWFGW